jgi:hypothetical protein
MAGYRFKCSICDDWHEGFPDVGYAQPDYAWNIPEAERAKRVILTSDLCAVDYEHYFIRGVLRVPILGTNEEFCWGVWTTLSLDNFRRYESHYDHDMSNWKPMFGWLSNQLPAYPETLNLKLSIQTRGSGDRPEFTLEPTDHPLAADQRDGIKPERLLEIVTPYLHHTN